MPEEAALPKRQKVDFIACTGEESDKLLVGESRRGRTCIAARGAARRFFGAQMDFGSSTYDPYELGVWNRYDYE